jgi:hypothetical protein
MLLTVKVLHTVVWAFFAGCVIAIPVMAWRGDAAWAVILIAVVSLEVLVLAVNRWRCPLTDVAARYTDDRADNFDIFLPRWLARWNKAVFGSLYAVGILATLARWLARV